MTKTEFVDQAIKDAGIDITRTGATKLIDAANALIGKQVRKGRIAVSGLGSFTIRNRKARPGRNPQTGEAIKIKASKNIGFKADSKLRAAAKI